MLAAWWSLKTNKEPVPGILLFPGWKRHPSKPLPPSPRGACPTPASASLLISQTAVLVDQGPALLPCDLLVTYLSITTKVRSHSTSTGDGGLDLPDGVTMQPVTVMLCSSLLHLFIFFNVFKFLLDYICFTIFFFSFYYTAELISYVYTYISFFGLPPQLRHHRALSRVPCAIH